ncbi:MAG: glycosyltransferase family 4 protein [Tepidisphaeraceae bacterium]|jgi:glycosyltransferase involved in cell wall biosynthesis
MKITFLMAYASMSGGTRVIAAQARQLIALGHEVRVVSTPPRPPGLRRTLSALVHRGHWPRTPPSGEFFFAQAAVPHRVISRYRAIGEQDVSDGDVVIATWWETAPWVWRLSPAKGAKAFFIQHYEIWGGDEKAVDAAWRLPLHKIVISRWLADLARDKFADPNVSLVPNSVDRSLFDAPPRSRQPRPTVGMLYNPARFKGCDVALKAVAAARRELGDLQLVSFGVEAPQEPLGPGCAFTLNPPQEKIRELYAQCDVWLCGSRSEGFHLPPLEAMACRCPVVSTKVGGPLDIIEQGRNGFLVDVEDHGELARRLVHVLRLSDDQWRQMSDAAYATACRYSWQDAAALMQRALEAAVANSAAPPGRLGVA